MNLKEHFFNNYGSYLGVAFFCIIAWLLQETITEIDWKKVGNSLAQTPHHILSSCLLLTFISFSIFSIFDYIGLRKTKTLTQPSPCIMLIAAFVCYAANFNFGGLLGAVGMRLKLYTDLGISKQSIAQIGVLSTVSNWIGYSVVAGSFFAIVNVKMPDKYNLDAVPWTLIGYCSLALVLFYIFLILRVSKFTVFSKKIPLPNVREGVLRLALGVGNWLSVTSILILIFANYLNAPIEVVITSYLTAAIAGVVTHIPAGLGVFEVIFLTLLSPHVGSEEIMSGILAYRAIYYIFPLLVGLVLITWLKLYRLPKLNRDLSHV